MSDLAISETQEPVDARVGAASAPAIELAISNALTAGVQQVQDENGNASALYLGTAAVGVGTPAPAYPLTVQGNRQWDSIMQVHGTGVEATIEFLNDTDKLRWHVGSTSSVPKTFEIWNNLDGIVLSIQNKELTFNGTITAKALVANGSFALQGIQPVSAAPKSANLESLIVDVNTGTLYYL